MLTEKLKDNKILLEKMKILSQINTLLVVGLNGYNLKNKKLGIKCSESLLMMKILI